MRRGAKRGINVADVVRVFRGARVISGSAKAPPTEKPQQRQLELIQGGKR